MHSATINQLSNTLRKGELGDAKAPLVLGNEVRARLKRADGSYLALAWQFTAEANSA